MSDLIERLEGIVSSGWIIGFKQESSSGKTYEITETITEAIETIKQLQVHINAALEVLKNT